MKKENQKLRDQMLGIMDQWNASSLSLLDYCESQNVSLSKFKYWQKKFKKEKSVESGFKSVEIIRPEPEELKSLGFIKIEYPHGVMVLVPSNIDQTTLQTLIGI